MPRPFSLPGRLLVPAVLVAALFLSLFYTRAMTPPFDSVRYANVARWIARGEGISTSLTVIPVQGDLPAADPKLSPFTIQPPGLPLFYALTGVDNRGGAHRVLHVLSFLALAWLVLILGRQLTGRDEVGAVAALLTLLSPALLQTLQTALADLPTLAFLLGGMVCLIRSREEGRRPVPWLLAASVLGALAVTFRLTALAFGAVLLADLILSRRLPGRRLLPRFAAGSGVFGTVTLAILLRNQLLVGSLFGTAARDWPMAPAYSLGRAWSYLGSRLMEALVPGWAFAPVQEKLSAANAGPGAWAVPALLLGTVLVLTMAVVGLRRAGRLPSWPASVPGAVDGARSLVLVLFVTSLVLLVVPAGRHAQFHVVEFRYVITLLPVVWIAVAALLTGAGPRWLGPGVGAALVILFALGVPAMDQPYTFSRDFLRPGLDWLGRTVPTETAVLTNKGKILLDEDLERRVYHISAWNFRHALEPGLQTQQGLLDYLRRQDIRYVVLFGTPGMHEARYWGRPLVGLFLEQWWQPWLAYRDQNMKVYRIPPTGPIPAQ